MKAHCSIRVLCAAIAVAALMASGCDSAPIDPGASGDAPGPPRIQFVRTHVDLEEVVVAGEGVSVSFPFVNRGDQPLTISGLVPACGDCTQQSVSSPVIEPEAAGEVLVMINPRKVEERSSGVRVLCNDPLQPETELTVSWRAVAALDTEPRRLDFARHLAPGETIVERLRVLRRGGSQAAAQVAGVRCRPRESLAATYFASDDQGTPEEVEVRVTGGPEGGNASGVVWIDVAGDTAISIRVPVTWIVAGTATVVPRSLFIGAGAPGAVFHADLTVLHAADRLVTVTDVTSDPAILGLQWEAAGSDGGEVKVALAGRLPETAGTVSGELVISLLCPEPRQERIPWSSIVGGPAAGADSPGPAHPEAVP